jgi:hypothetical protein
MRKMEDMRRGLRALNFELNFEMELVSVAVGVSAGCTLVVCSGCIFEGSTV